MEIKKVAVLLTVYNRREITLQGLRSLYNAINYLGKGYQFDIYMTDDGSTDGTSDAVAKEFPSVHIVQGTGNLFWSGGMRMAWKTAVDSCAAYDYYLWYNDDSILYEDALKNMFIYYTIDNPNVVIITGAFCDKKGSVSYGGKTDGDKLISPDGTFQKTYRMNGNLVLIPQAVYEELGMISTWCRHGFGDYDYGYRAAKQKIPVLLSCSFVGRCERHDVRESKYFSNKYTIVQRWNMLHSPMNNPFVSFIFNYKYNGIAFALKSLITTYIYTVFPIIYKKRNFFR